MSGNHSITIVIPTLNEEKNLPVCLASIERQDYPRSLVEVIVVDNGSGDSTVAVARKHGAKVLTNAILDAERSKMIGLHESSADFFMYLDADIELAGTAALSQLERALRENEDVVGAFPRFAPKKTAPSFSRCLRYHPLELDPVLDFFCTRPEAVAIERRSDLIICDFSRKRVPPVGICLYRRTALVEALGGSKRFMDIDVPVILAGTGRGRMAYLPKAKIHHNSIANMSELVKRSRRNLQDVFLPGFAERKFRYLSPGSKKDFAKAILLVALANTPVYFLARGIWKSIAHRDIACMWEPAAACVLVDALIAGLLGSKKGREYIRYLLGFGTAEK